MILNSLKLSDPLSSEITMKNQEFPEYIPIFTKHFHISHPKKAEDREPSNEFKIQGLDSKPYLILVEMRHAK